MTKVESIKLRIEQADGVELVVEVTPEQAEKLRAELNRLGRETFDRVVFGDKYPTIPDSQKWPNGPTVTWTS